MLRLAYPQVKQVEIAKSYLYVREVKSNSSKEIDQFLKSVGRKPGDSWCAAFVSFCLTEAKVKSPTKRTGLARAFISKSTIKAKDIISKKIKIPCGALVIWQHGSTIFGHIGFVLNWDGMSGETIEGNTSGKFGEGVYIKKRYIQSTNYFRITNFEYVKN